MLQARVIDGCAYGHRTVVGHGRQVKVASRRRQGGGELLEQRLASPREVLVVAAPVPDVSVDPDGSGVGDADV